MKLKSFCKAKNIVNRTKQRPVDYEKIFAKPTSDSQHPKYTKNSRSQTQKKKTPKNPIIKLGKKKKTNSSIYVT